MARVRVLLTGGTGYIGYRLLSELRDHHAQEYSPVAIVRTPAKAVVLDRLLDRPAPPSEPPVCIADLFDSKSLRNAVRGVKIVVHLAADMDLFPATSGRVTAVNVDGTRNLLKVCAEEAARTGTRIRFIYASSTEAIGPEAEKGEPADECRQLNPDCEYGRSKVLAEAVVREYEADLDCVILRLSGVYGPGERFFFYEFMSMVNVGLLVVSPGPLTGEICLAHIDDVVQGILLSMRRPQAVGQVYILTSDESHSYKEVVTVMADALKRSRPVATIPLFLAKWMIICIAPFANWRKQRIFMFVSLSFNRNIFEIHAQKPISHKAHTNSCCFPLNSRSELLGGVKIHSIPILWIKP
jgi:dihydroflavonol-4-reductase